VSTVNNVNECYVIVVTPFGLQSVQVHSAICVKGHDIMPQTGLAPNDVLEQSIAAHIPLKFDCATEISNESEATFTSYYCNIR
jgi:hypothetical protein